MATVKINPTEKAKVKQEDGASRVTFIRASLLILLIVFVAAVLLMNFAPAMGWKISAF